MKVDGITLLQMIKDEKIRSDTEIDVYYNNGTSEFMTRLYYDGFDLKWHPKTFRARYFYNRFIEFEIIEEDKETEEIKITNDNRIIDDTEAVKHYVTTNRKDRNIYIKKINELVIAVNKLKKESKNGK